jgi:hypothetical protein
MPHWTRRWRESFALATNFSGEWMLIAVKIPFETRFQFCPPSSKHSTEPKYGDVLKSAGV